MASEVTVYSRDGNWKAEIEAWLNNFWVYSSIGTQVSVYRKAGRSIWGGANWDGANARNIMIHNSFNGGKAFREGNYNNVDHAELKEWAPVGVSLSLTEGSPGVDISPEAADLILSSVDGRVSGYFGNGESFSANVHADSAIADSSLW